MPVDPDLELRRAAVERARALAARYDDVVPVSALREGFTYAGGRVSFGSFQKGIHRPAAMRGRAALTLTSSVGDPYGDQLDAEAGEIVYRYRAGPIDQADNRALRAAFQQQVPLVYFRGIAPGQYLVVTPVFVTRDDPAAGAVLLQVGLPLMDMGPEGPQSSQDVREYALREVRYRLHQQRFRLGVLHAYRHRCAICALRERSLVQAAHIVSDSSPEGIAAVVNGLALCAIHHLAYDRNVLGIDPDGVVHIAHRVLVEHDGPMLRAGLQGFHHARIEVPRRREDRPDPRRLELRFRQFEEDAA